VVVVRVLLDEPPSCRTCVRGTVASSAVVLAATRRRVDSPTRAHRRDHGPSGRLAWAGRERPTTTRTWPPVGQLDRTAGALGRWGACGPWPVRRWHWRDESAG